MGPPGPAGGFWRKSQKTTLAGMAHPTPPFGPFLRGSSLPGQNPLKKGQRKGVTQGGLRKYPLEPNGTLWGPGTGEPEQVLKKGLL